MTSICTIGLIACGAPQPLEQTEAIRDASGRVRYIVELAADATTGFPATAPSDGRFGSYHRPQARHLVASFENQYSINAVAMTSWVGNTFTAWLTPQQVRTLGNDPRVTRIVADRWVSFSTDAKAVWTDTTLPSGEIRSWGKQAVNPIAGSNSAGTVRVYVVDGGVDFHSDLNVVQRVNAINPSLTDAPHLIACYQHSTHVSGIIGALINGSGVQGIDPGASIVSVSVLDPGTSNGTCLTAPSAAASAIVSGLDWVRQDIAARGRAGVVNLSLNANDGSFDSAGIVGLAMRRAATPAAGYPGAFIAQSAGNQYTDACTRAYNAPSAADGIMVVGAINDHGQPVTPLNGLNAFRNGTLAGSERGSNYGGCVEVWAPGNAIISTWSGGTAPLSGTSMAAPHIAGLAAYLAEAQGLTTPAQIEQAVRSSMVSLQTADRAGLPVNLATLNGAMAASTPYAEMAISKSAYASPFGTNATLDPATVIFSGDLIFYSDESQTYTVSLDSVGGGSYSCDLNRTSGGTTQLLANTRQYYASPVSVGGQNASYSSSACPSAHASVAFRPAPRAHWLVNGYDRTGSTLDWNTGSAGTLGFTSENAVRCDLVKGIKDQWSAGYVPQQTIPNVGLSASSVYVIPQNGNWQYSLTCSDSYGTTRIANIYLNVTVPPPVPVSGSWWNPSRSGNGWSISSNSSGTLLLYWLTYTPWGSPIWYYATVGVCGSSYCGALYSAVWNGSGATLTSRGSVTLTPSTNQAAAVSWTLDGASGGENIQYMAFGGSGWAPRLTGAWYPPSESGWGLALDVQGSTMVADVLFYDAGGQPTWLTGSANVQNSIDVGLLYVTGTNLCPGCTGTPSTSYTWAGSMHIDQVDFYNASLSTWFNPQFGQWSRSGLPIARSTY